MQEMFTKDLQELKNKLTEMNNILEGINSRIIEVTEAEEQINDLETEWCKSLPQNRIHKKRMEKKRRQPKRPLGHIKRTNIHIIGVPEGGK